MLDHTDLSKPASVILKAGEDALWESNFNYEIRCVAAVLRAAALYCKRDNLILLSIADELEES